MSTMHFLRGRAIGALTLCALLAAPTGAAAQDGGGQQQDKGSARITKPPALLEASEADYTQEAIDARVEGPVKLRLTISATGNVTKVEVLEGPGYGLDESAAKAAEQFKFSPAEINGVASPIILTFTINFELPILPSEFEGFVIDSGTGQGLAGAEITILYVGEEPYEEPPAASTFTDEEGKFFFGNIPPGPYKVRLILDAYRDYETSIDMVQGEKSEATYKIDAQPVNYTGRVRESGTRKILPGVTIELTQIGDIPKGKQPIVRQEFTDANGEFSMRGLPPGEYNVLIDAQGYKSETFIEKITANERLEGSYFIDAEYYDEYTVTTTSKRERREVNRQTLTLKESRRIPGTGGDVTRVVQNLPGVARAPFGTGQIIVRGSNPQDSAVFLKGDEIPIVYHFLSGPAVINSEMIQSIDFYPGNFSARYGRAIGGIIDLQTRSPRDDGFHGFAEVDIQDASALVEAPITEDLTFALSGRRSYIDQVLKIAVPDDALPFSIAPYYYDYQGWLTYRGLENHKFELFLYGSRDELRLLLDEPQGDSDVQITSINQETEFHRGQMRWEWNPDENISNTMMATFGLITSGVNAGNAFAIDSDFWTANVRDDLELKISNRAKVRAGVDMQFAYSTIEATLPSFGDSDPGSTPNPIAEGLADDFNLAVSYPAFWAEVQLKPIDQLMLTPGVRMDHYSNNTQTTVSPRLTGRFNITETVAAKGGVGLFDQPPDPGTTFGGFGNPDLVSEKAIHYALGAEWRPLDYLEFDVTGFFRDSYDLVSSTTEFEVDEETGEVDFKLFENEGEGRSYGAEFLIRHYPNNRFFGWLAYTLSRSERLNPETGEYELFDFDQTHIFTAVAGYNLPYNIDVSARFRFVTGNPYTPIVGSVFDADEDTYIPVQGDPNSARNAPFNQLDIRVDKSFVFDAWMLGVYLDVQNVYYAKNPEGVLYNYDYTESAPLSGIPIFPNLGVNARF